LGPSGRGAARRSITLDFRLTVGPGRCNTPALVRLRRLCALLSVVALPLLAWALLPVVSTGADSASIQRRIARDNAAIDTKKRHEGVLTTDITAYNRRIDALQGNISKLQAREDRQPAGGRPRADEVEGRAVEADHQETRHRSLTPGCSRGP